MEATRVAKILAAAATLTLIVSGCAAEVGSESSQGPSGSESGTVERSGALTAEDIIAAIEPDGFECGERDPRLDGREQMIVCEADDVVFITAWRMTDTKELELQLKTLNRLVCEDDMTEKVRVAASGVWMLVPGGERDKDIAAFDKAMGTLGLDWTTEDPC